MKALTKRFMDIAIAASALVILLPLLCALAFGVRLSMGRPVLFSQLRPGLHGQLFRMYKFRTMRPAVPGSASGGASDAVRLTRFGQFMRSTSLDELPELWNVLKGEMSVVGPRPLLPEYLPLYTPEQARRHLLRPGITGWAQVNGRNSLDWPRRFALDVWYVDNQSLVLDLKILLLTLVQVVRRAGVNQPGHATVEYFRGNAPAEKTP